MSTAQHRYQHDVSGFHRAVVLLALLAWVLARWVCPVPEEISDATPDTPSSLSAQTPGLLKTPRASFDQVRDAEPQQDEDLCCQILGHTNAIVAAPAVFSEGYASVPVFALAVAIAALVVGTVRPFVKLYQSSNGPPRSRYQRFLTFWSRAPPY